MNITNVPHPSILRDTASLTVLHRELGKAKLALENVHNLARSTFQPGMQLVFTKTGNPNPILAKVVTVIGQPGRTRITVERLSNGRREDIQIEDITGIVQP